MNTTAIYDVPTYVVLGKLGHFNLLAPALNLSSCTLIGVDQENEVSVLEEHRGSAYGVVNCGWVDNDSQRRRRAWALLREYDLTPASTPGICPARGLIVLPNAFIGPGCAFGENVLINVGALLPHDVTVGSHTHIAPGAILAAGVTVGEGCLVGMGVTVYKGVTIGHEAVICNGANVVMDVPPGKVVQA